MPDQKMSVIGVEEESLAKGFDERLARSFCNKSVSAETRRPYHRNFREFLGFTNDRHPHLILAEEVLRWRDELRSRRQKNATVALKLAVVRSFCEYLKAAGWLTLNPDSTKLLSPPLV